MNWTYMPFWSMRVIGVIAVALLLLAIARWRGEGRGGRILFLRLVILAGLLWVILNPQSLLPREHTARPKLIVLIDSSGSMATRDAGPDSRFAAATKVLTDPKTLAALNREFDVEFRAFDREARTVSWPAGATNSPAGDTSDIASALTSAVSELGDAKAQAGVLLISDGRATTSGTLDAAQLALARSVPLWTWTLGGPVPRQDAWMETASSEALAFSGAEVELAASLRTAGYSNRSFKVEILTADKTIETREVVPDDGGAARISVRVKAPDAGEQRYVFRVAPQPEESDVANNERSIFLRSVGEKVRVLVAEGQPHWDTKFLVQSLKQNPNVELTAVYRLNSTRHLAVVSAVGTETRVEQDLFPRTANAMNAFDILVLGRGAEDFFDERSEGLITDFVARRGGSVVFARGKAYGGRFQPLAKLEPVAWGSGLTSAVKLHPTEAGRDNPIFDLGSAGTVAELLDRLPALDQASVTLGEKPLAVVLADSAAADGPVLVAYQRYGQGRALTLNASGLWRWSFREIGQEQSEIAYRHFWVSLLQWLLGGSQFLPGSDVALTSARRYYTSEQPMQFMISTRNLDRAAYQPRLVISRSETNVVIEPRPRGESFVAEAGPFPPGTYQVVLKNNVGQPPELSQMVEVRSASVEKQELSADPGIMSRIADASGGRVVNASDIPRLAEIVRHWEAARELAHRQKPLWDRPWLLATVLVLLAGEWYWRRREGLL